MDQENQGQNWQVKFTSCPGDDVRFTVSFIVRENMLIELGNDSTLIMDQIVLEGGNLEVIGDVAGFIVDDLPLEG